jgi:hypothetical protein
MTAANGALAVVAQKSCSPRRSGNKARPTLPFYLIVGAFLERSSLQPGEHGIDTPVVDGDALDTLPPSGRYFSAVALSSLPPSFNRSSEGRGSVVLPARQDSRGSAPAGTRSPYRCLRSSSTAHALPESRKPLRSKLDGGPDLPPKNWSRFCDSVVA